MYRVFNSVIFAFPNLKMFLPLPILKVFNFFQTLIRIYKTLSFYNQSVNRIYYLEKKSFSKKITTVLLYNTVCLVFVIFDSFDGVLSLIYFDLLFLSYATVLHNDFIKIHYPNIFKVLVTILSLLFFTYEVLIFCKISKKFFSIISNIFFINEGQTSEGPGGSSGSGGSGGSEGPGGSGGSGGPGGSGDSGGAHNNHRLHEEGCDCYSCKKGPTINPNKPGRGDSDPFSSTNPELDGAPNGAVKTFLNRKKTIKDLRKDCDAIEEMRNQP